MIGTGRALLLTAGVAAGSIAVDRALKHGVEQHLDEGERLQGPLGTSIVRRTNHAGIAHVDPASGSHGALVAAGGVLAAGIATAGVLLGRTAPLAAAGAGLIAGGMASNLHDRAAHGHVTDFLPSPLGLLNAADVAIAAGIAIGGIGLLLR